MILIIAMIEFDRFQAKIVHCNLSSMNCNSNFEFGICEVNWGYRQKNQETMENNEKLANRQQLVEKLVKQVLCVYLNNFQCFQCSNSIEMSKALSVSLIEQVRFIFVQCKWIPFVNSLERNRNRVYEWRNRRTERRIRRTEYERRVETERLKDELAK